MPLFRKAALRKKPSVKMTASMRLAMATFLALIALQGVFWYHTRDIQPEIGIVPDVPGERTVRALSFGDEEVFFRLYALNIQNSGDTFGRFTALYKYDFKKLQAWFLLLDKLNNQSNYLPAMATYYFSQTQNPTDVSYIVDYLDSYTKDRVQDKWWWVVQGVYLAQHKMDNLDRAQQLAERLRGVRGIPIWAQQTPAFLHEQRGEFADALSIIEDIAKDPSQYTQGELNFMKYFVDERLHKLDETQKEFDKIQKTKDELKAKGIKEPALDAPPSDVGAAKGPGAGPDTN